MRFMSASQQVNQPRNQTVKKKKSEGVTVAADWLLKSQ